LPIFEAIARISRYLQDMNLPATFIIALPRYRVIWNLATKLPLSKVGTPRKGDGRGISTDITYIPHPEVSQDKFWQFGKIDL